MVSKKREYQIARAAKGWCVRCPGRVGLYKEVCDSCAAKARERSRARQGSKPWVPGKAGRPPLVVGPAEVSPR